MQDKRNQAINTDLSEQGSFINKLLDPQGYGLPVVIALALHIVIIALFAIEWPEEKRQIAEPTPKNIQAKVIQTESKQAKKRKLAEEKRLKNENWKKYLDKKKAAKQKARKDKAKRDKAAKAKLAKDEARKDKARKDKARKDKAKKEKLNADKAKQVALEKERAEKEQQAFDEQQEQELLEALAVEEQQRSMDQALADEQQTQRDAAITNDIVSQIQAKIYEAWRYPPSARPEMEVIVRISLVPTGEVIQVTLEKSSGNQALDRSVLAAVKRAQPLPVPKDSRLFEQQFRNFAMTFRPEDAVW
ncbi:protein TolA [Oleispira antarctica]|uniref:Protein TolA n=1 Tax=Oleispira antarctica TaxID=188908 RepID=A0A1Y5HUB9_OLEAN|nr:protein TolA [Oleispira antarctica]